MAKRHLKEKERQEEKGKLLFRNSSLSNLNLNLSPLRFELEIVNFLLIVSFSSIIVHNRAN